jgi:hypothetical protein
VRKPKGREGRGKKGGGGGGGGGGVHITSIIKTLWELGPAKTSFKENNCGIEKNRRLTEANSTQHPSS